jgi:hypothetical protein
MQNIVSIDPYYNVDRMTKEVEEAKRERKSGEASTLRYTNIGLFLGMVHIGVGTSTVKEAKNPTQNSEKQKVVEEQLKADGGFMMAPYAEIGDSGLYINNWGQGMLKNYIQMTTAMLARGKTGETTIKKEELKNLKSDTLYVPEYIKYVSGLAGVGRTAATDPRELFSSYKHNYSVVSVADLNKKIMQSTSDMYYIMFISGMGGNTLYVVNGFTGTVVYSTNITLGTSLDSGDIKDLSQKVNKS